MHSASKLKLNKRLIALAVQELRIPESCQAPAAENAEKDSKASGGTAAEKRRKRSERRLFDSLAVFNTALKQIGGELQCKARKCSTVAFGNEGDFALLAVFAVSALHDCSGGRSPVVKMRWNNGRIFYVLQADIRSENPLITRSEIRFAQIVAERNLWSFRVRKHSSQLLFFFSLPVSGKREGCVLREATVRFIKNALFEGKKTCFDEF